MTTNDMMTLRVLSEKSSDANLLREIVERYRPRGRRHRSRLTYSCSPGRPGANNAIINMIAITVIIQNKRKLPKPFNSFADMHHHHADSRKRALRALARPG